VRIVCDPNVLVSAAVATGVSAELLDRWFTDRPLRHILTSRRAVARYGCNVYAATVRTKHPTGSPMQPDIPSEVDDQRRRIVAELGRLGFTLPGSIVTRTVTCGKPACRCATDPERRHGPYIQWSRTVKGRTVNKVLTPEQLERYQPWIDNGRRLRELAHQLETLSLEAMRDAEGWHH
jgi:hypothetical protein